MSAAVMQLVACVREMLLTGVESFVLWFKFGVCLISDCATLISSRSHRWDESEARIRSHRTYYYYYS